MKGDPIRGFLELLNIFDWITPAIGLVQDIVNDPTLFQSNSWTFFMPLDGMARGGWSAFGIEDLMDKYNIKHWGSQVTNGQFFFSVRKDQAIWAEYILLKYGVDLPDSSLPLTAWANR